MIKVAYLREEKAALMTEICVMVFVEEWSVRVLCLRERNVERRKQW